MHTEMVVYFLMASKAFYRFIKYLRVPHKVFCITIADHISLCIVGVEVGWGVRLQQKHLFKNQDSNAILYRMVIGSEHC